MKQLSIEELNASGNLTGIKLGGSAADNDVLIRSDINVLIAAGVLDAKNYTDSVTIPEAPKDGKIYGRKDGQWVEVVVLTFTTITGFLLSGETGFSFETDLGTNFTVEQDGVKNTYTGNGSTLVSITGLNDIGEIIIELGDSSYFKFRDDKWLSLNLRDIAKIKTLEDSFNNLTKMESFACDADTSNVISLKSAWTGCLSMNSFPLIDTSSCTDYTLAWAICESLTSFPLLDFSAGTIFTQAWFSCSLPREFEQLDFRSLTDGASAFDTCPELTQPPSTGTEVRSENNATQGTWINQIPQKKITGFLLSGQTGFDFETDAGEDFTVEQGAIINTYTGNGTTPVTVTGINDSEEITIQLIGNNTYFRFQSNSWLSLNLVELENITTLFASFAELTGMKTFRCDADTSNVTDVVQTWGNCTGLISFPLVDFRSVTEFGQAWGNCTTLETFEQLDFSSLIGGVNAFLNCISLVEPLASGTEVRNENNATQGTWTKP